MFWKILESLPGTGHQKETFTDCTCIVKRCLSRIAIKHTLRKACPGIYFLWFLLLQGGSAVQVWGEVDSSFWTQKELGINQICKGWWRQPQLVPSAFITTYSMKEQKTKPKSHWMEKFHFSLFCLFSHQRPFSRIRNRTSKSSSSHSWQVSVYGGKSGIYSQ